MSLSLCVGQEGTPASRDEAEPRAQLCSTAEQRFSSSNTAGVVIQPALSPQIPALMLEKLAARADFWEQEEGRAAPVAVEVHCRCSDLSLLRALAH